MRFECWITKATDTPSEYVMFIAFPRNQCLREGASMLHYKYTASFLAFDSSSLQNTTGDKGPELRAQLLPCLICRSYEFTVFYLHFFLCWRGLRPEREVDHYVRLMSTLNHSLLSNYPSRGALLRTGTSLLLPHLVVPTACPLIVDRLCGTAGTVSTVTALTSCSRTSAPSALLPTMIS